MARFPLSGAEILALGQEVISGLTAHAATFPAPPVSVADLQSALAAFVNAREAAIDARAVAEQATAVKNEAQQALVAALKSVIRYAENTVDYDDDQLKLLGWGGRDSRTSLQPPGQPRLLEAVKEGAGWIMLDWKKPESGGAVAAYKVQRRPRESGDYIDVGTTLETEITLVDQTRGTEWEYRVIAVNKAGESEASNTVMAVL